MEKKTAVRIVIEYSDGSCDVAEGEAADQIKKWYDSAESMLCLHGAIYRGPKFVTLEPEETKEPRP